MMFAMKVRIEGMNEKDRDRALAAEFGVADRVNRKAPGYRGKGIEADQRKAETEDWLNTVPPKKPIRKE